MSSDPYSDPVTGVLFNKLGLDTASGLETAEREITHAALILLHESPVTPTYDLRHLREIHRRIFREGNGRAQRAFFGQLARDAGYTLDWQHLDPIRNIEASAASLRGDLEPLRKMLDALVNEGT